MSKCREQFFSLSIFRGLWYTLVICLVESFPIMHISKICIVKPGLKMHICEICIVMPCLRPILRGNKTCNKKQNLQQVLYYPVLAWKIVFTKLAASFVGLHVSTKLALVLQHRLTTNTFVCQHLQHYRRLMLSLALSWHTPSSLIICSSPCLAHHRHAGGRNQRFVESNHQKEMQSKQCSSDIWICLKTLANHQSGMTASGLHFSTLEFSRIPWPS